MKRSNARISPLWFLNRVIWWTSFGDCASFYRKSSDWKLNELWKIPSLMFHWSLQIVNINKGKKSLVKSRREKSFGKLSVWLVKHRKAKAVPLQCIAQVFSLLRDVSSPALSVVYVLSSIQRWAVFGAMNLNALWFKDIIYYKIFKGAHHKEETNLL